MRLGDISLHMNHLWGDERWGATTLCYTGILCASSCTTAGSPVSLTDIFCAMRVCLWVCVWVLGFIYCYEILWWEGENDIVIFSSCAYVTGSYFQHCFWNNKMSQQQLLLFFHVVLHAGKSRHFSVIVEFKAHFPIIWRIRVTNVVREGNWKDICKEKVRGSGKGTSIRSDEPGLSHRLKKNKSV